MKRRHSERNWPLHPGRITPRDSREKRHITQIFCAIALCICLMAPLTTLALSPDTIGPGEESDRVLQLQTALTSLGYKCGNIDGKYGSATENAIRRFQKDYKLSVDGLAGKATQEMIYKKLAEKNATPTPVPDATPAPNPADFLPHQVFMGNYTTMMQGSSGQRVSVLQGALQTLGFYAQKVDGKFGLGTHRAVVAYQKHSKMTADGLAGKATLRRIEEGLLQASQNEQPQPTPLPTHTPAPQDTTALGSSLALFGGDYTTLSKGAKGVRVTTLQAALGMMGYSTGKDSGTFGQSTHNALIRFQREQKLTADGLAGPSTLRRIETLLSASVPTAAPSATPAPTSTPAPVRLFGGNYALISEGAAADRIKSLQAGLSQLGHYTGKLDGVLGQGTKEAVRQFQTAQSLKADGIAGRATLKKLDDLVAGDVTPAPLPTPTPELPQLTAAPAPTPRYAMLQLGSKGDAVTQLQQGLKNLSYPVEVNGTYDSITKSAVEAFQNLNRLTPDGVAGEKTQEKLYSGSAVSYQAPGPTLAPDTGSYQGPKEDDVQLLHWFDDIKPKIRAGQHILVYDPATQLGWTLRLYSLGRHADAEPLTATDTAVMYKAFGNQFTWNQKAVLVRLPSGTWIVASTHDMPHLSGAIKDNNFDGHLCVHFLRDMKETQVNDPSYGVANQRTIRAYWKKLTGQDVAEKVRE